MTAKVFTLDTQPGIQRDGTVFDKTFYNDGEWVRFQRGRPRKVLGYRVISRQLTGPSRGIWVNPQNAFTSIFSGYNNGLQVLTIDNNGVGAGVGNFTLTNFTASDLNLWQFDGFYDVAGTGLQSLVAHPGQNLASINNSTNTPVLIGDINALTMQQVGVFTDVGSTTNASPNVTFAATNTLMGAGQTVTGAGIPANTTVVSTSLVSTTITLAGVAITGVAGQFSCSATTLLSNQSIVVTGTLTGTGSGISAGTYYIIATNGTTTFTLSATYGGPAIVTTAGTTSGLTFVVEVSSLWTVVLSANATATASVTLTFNNNISVSGGVVSLHPYLFVYGNNGLIQNCSAGNTNDWVSADANANNVASGKIVQGLPVRGGSNAPSGLFWSLDSLIRVSFIGGTGTPPQYWRYDIVSSQSSILSSQSAIEYDGVYYWCGVDRFLLYNGVVKEIPNNMNQNYFFDNLNYDQRQKVWVTKVPRYGEIWWFYPRGDATECTDAIIYNVRENVWYDAGEARGAQRSAGYFSQVFAFPVAADWHASEAVAVFTDTFNEVTGSVFLYSDTYNTQVALTQVISGTGIPSGTTVVAITTSNIKTLGAITGGSGYVDATYTNVTLTGGSGSNAKATIVVSGGAVTTVTITARGAGYLVGNALSATAASLGGTGAGFSIPVTAIYAQAIQMSAAATATGAESLTFSIPANLIAMYQHEIGTDEIDGQDVLSISSSFETSELSLLVGGPSQQAREGQNRWLRLERIEPDFLQSGDMSVVVTGRPFAQGEDKESDPYVFGPNTGKIDMREQRRELRLKFTSDAVGGNYQLGKLLLDAEVGDVRPYGP
tara:strand:- start:4603 stop:7089 length:2487 start_codon:yes stop_codon:yes gene_type:complete